MNPGQAYLQRTKREVELAGLGSYLHPNDSVRKYRLSPPCDEEAFDDAQADKSQLDAYLSWYNERQKVMSLVEQGVPPHLVRHDIMDPYQAMKVYASAISYDTPLSEYSATLPPTLLPRQSSQTPSLLASYLPSPAFPPVPPQAFPFRPPHLANPSRPPPFADPSRPPSVAPLPFPTSSLRPPPPPAWSAPPPANPQRGSFNIIGWQPDEPSRTRPARTSNVPLKSARKDPTSRPTPQILDASTSSAPGERIFIKEMGLLSLLANPPDSINAHIPLQTYPAHTLPLTLLHIQPLPDYVARITRDDLPREMDEIIDSWDQPAHGLEGDWDLFFEDYREDEKRTLGVELIDALDEAYPHRLKKPDQPLSTAKLVILGHWSSLHTDRVGLTSRAFSTRQILASGIHVYDPETSFVNLHAGVFGINNKRVPLVPDTDTPWPANLLKASAEFTLDQVTQLEGRVVVVLGREAKKAVLKRLGECKQWTQSLRRPHLWEMDADDVLCTLFRQLSINPSEFDELPGPTEPLSLSFALSESLYIFSPHPEVLNTDAERTGPRPLELAFALRFATDFISGGLASGHFQPPDWTIVKRANTKSDRKRLLDLAEYQSRNGIHFLEDCLPVDLCSDWHFQTSSTWVDGFREVKQRDVVSHMLSEVSALGRERSTTDKATEAAAEKRRIHFRRIPELKWKGVCQCGYECSGDAFTFDEPPRPVLTRVQVGTENHPRPRRLDDKTRCLQAIPLDPELLSRVMWINKSKVSQPSDQTLANWREIVKNKV